MIENNMVVGDYYTDRKVARSERLDELIRDAEFLRSWEWLDWAENEGLTRELLTDLASAVLSSRDAKEAGAEARAVLMGYIEDYAGEAVREEA